MMMAMLRQLDTHGDGVIRPNEIDPGGGRCLTGCAGARV